MGPTWDRQDPGGPHVDHVNLVMWGYSCNPQNTYTFIIFRLPLPSVTPDIPVVFSLRDITEIGIGFREKMSNFVQHAAKWILGGGRQIFKDDINVHEQ